MAITSFGLFQWINLWVAIFIVAFAYCDRRYKIRESLKKWQLKPQYKFLRGKLTFEVGNSKSKIGAVRWLDSLAARPGGMYFIFSYFTTVAFFVVDYLFTDFSQGNNVLTLRVLNGVLHTIDGTRGAGHWLIWVALLIIYVRYGATDIIRGVYLAGFLVAAHETYWYIFYFMARPVALDYIFQYIAFIVLALALFVSYGINCAGLEFKEGKIAYNKDLAVIPRKKLLYALVVMGFFFAGWYLAGYHITVDNVTGKTQYYGNLDVNFIEDLSWGFFCALLI